jgi:SNF2 family DNA or RNA helicase
MNFILPSHFANAMDSLRTIFKVKGDTKVSLLAQERVSRAKKMMTPFVLRRRKDQVSSVLFVRARGSHKYCFRWPKSCRKRPNASNGVR